MTSRVLGPVVALALLLGAGCTSGPGDAPGDAGRSPATSTEESSGASGTDVPDEDEEAARLREIFAGADAVEWDAEVTDEDDRVFYRMSGRHLVDGSSSEMTMFIGRRREDRIVFLGPRTVVQSTSWPDHVENCWIDITSTPRFQGDLPADPDPLAALDSLRPVRLADGGVAGGVPVEVAGALFPRDVFAGLDLEGEADEVVVGFTEQDGAVSYVIAMQWMLAASGKVKAVERLMKLPNARLSVTVRPADDASPVEAPAPGLTLEPGERPEKPCPASV